MAAILVICLVGAWALTRWAISYAQRRDLIDHINERSSHAAPTPRGGGLAIVTSALAGFVAAQLAVGGSPAVVAGLIGGGLGIAIVGWIDDHGHVNPGIRLSVHLLAGWWLIRWTGGLGEYLGQGPVAAAVVDGVLVLLIAWIVNLYNFMDGVDGLAASEAAYVALGAAFILLAGGGAPLAEAAPALVLAAATLGFLRWNWPPARIFMGDISSGFLGFAIAALILVAGRRDFSQGVAVALLLGTFLADTGVTMLRRLLTGQPVFRAHRSHAYQILARRWQSHRRVTLANLAVTSGWLTPVAMLASAHVLQALPALAAGILPLMLLAWWIGAGRPDA